MKEINILVVGTHPEIMATILRLLNNKPGWQATGASTLPEVTKLAQEQKFDVVLIGAGINEDDTLQINQTFQGIPVVLHYGGGSGLLYAEVYQALDIIPE
jgi:DNA-binding NarL/FixJ family response regulator